VRWEKKILLVGCTLGSGETNSDREKKRKRGVEKGVRKKKKENS